MLSLKRKKRVFRLIDIPITQLLFRLLVVLVMFSLSRWLIYLFNTEFFHHLTLREAFKLYFVGMRFDMVVIAYANILLILYYCLPLKIIYNKVLQKIMGIYYVLLNSVIIFLNMADVVYFQFLGQRMTRGLFRFLGNSDKSIGAIVGQMLVDYWYVLVLIILFVLVLVVVSKQTYLDAENKVPDNKWNTIQWVSLAVFSILTVIAARGGIQARPISTDTALLYTDSQNMPIVTNAPFNLAKASSNYELTECHYFNPEEMDFTPIHYSTQAERFLTDSLEFQPNLVFIILESYGQEMIGYYNPQQRHPLTPFLDSLLTQSHTFDGRANGRRSIESLPSLFSGIPSLMDIDMASSPYSNNKVDGLGSILKAHGYNTSMFHGGNNGTKKFDEYAQKTGFDHYYGRNEYGNDDDYDGRSGIFDGPYMQYCLQKLDNESQPFATVIYTLSSQHPYIWPKEFQLPPESYLWSGFEKTVYYTDCALRDFFAEAATKPWYDSTLFVITANHANTEHYSQEYSNVWGMYSIPIAFYMPSRIEPMRNMELAQQIDLNVSILSALGINDTVFSFGRNLFDAVSDPFCIAYINQTYQYSDGRYLLQSDGNTTIGVFNIGTDHLLDNNLIDHVKCDDLSRKLKECIQEYNNRFIHNQLFIDKNAINEPGESVY